MEAVDLSMIHPSLRYLYGDGVPARVTKVGGATVRVFTTFVAKDEETRTARLREAWRIADGIAARAAQKGGAASGQ